ncbi:hypothetical protein ACLOAU_16410 [Niabella sp. CJ426]|uniref:hypothetical protein n=1 Tax=Niabella sp. CJ426 TaxID=3393740 RepID=UPI003D03ABD2
MKTKILLSAFLFALANTGHAQSTIELLGNPGAGGPVGNGPSTANRTVTLYVNNTTVHNPLITATYVLSNQQFSSIEGNPTVPGVVFGSNLPSATNPNLAPAPGAGAPLYNFMSYAGNPQAAHYTACNSCAPGTGIVPGSNRGIEMQSFADALIDAANNNLYPVNARVQFADLTINFNRPVTNPVLQIAGMGGDFFYPGPTGNNYTHGYATELDLLTPGLTLKRLSGSSKFDVIGNTIKDTAAYLGANSMGATSSTMPSILYGVTRYGAGGSVAVLGNNITTVSFRIYIQGDAGMVTTSAGVPTTPDAGYTIKWAAALGGVEPEGSLRGDAMTIGLSMMDPVDISGNVFNDPNGGNVDNSSGVTNAVPAGMYINLVDANNVVVASAPVATDGTYTLPAIFEGTYTAVLSTTNLPLGSTPVSSTLPDGWTSTGEYTGLPNTGNDGNINGTSIQLNVDATSTNITNVNFAIKTTTLPVLWGPITATLKNNDLQVSWSTLKEISNSRFEIEASTDGKNFVKMGTVDTKAKNGDSDIEISYQFQAAASALKAFAAIGLLALLPAFKRKKWLATGIAAIIFTLLNMSCNKSNADAIGNTNDKIFIRIVQIDKDGTRSYSKTIGVTKN